MGNMNLKTLGNPRNWIILLGIAKRKKVGNYQDGKFPGKNPTKDLPKIYMPIENVHTNKIIKAKYYQQLRH